VIRKGATVTADPSPFFTSDRTAVRTVMRAGIGWAHPAAVVRITVGARPTDSLTDRLPDPGVNVTGARP
jgi:hypothetical protein